jgi:hypothetical protein
MGWSAIFDIINKWLPGREEINRRKIRKLKEQINELEDQPWTPDTADRLAVLIKQLSELEKIAQDR